MNIIYSVNYNVFLYPYSISSVQLIVLLSKHLKCEIISCVTNMRQKYLSEIDLSLIFFFIFRSNIIIPQNKINQNVNRWEFTREINRSFCWRKNNITTRTDKIYFMSYHDYLITCTLSRIFQRQWIYELLTNGLFAELKITVFSSDKNNNDIMCLIFN